MKKAYHDRADDEQRAGGGFRSSRLPVGRSEKSLVVIAARGASELADDLPEIVDAGNLRGAGRDRAGVIDRGEGAATEQEAVIIESEVLAGSGRDGITDNLAQIIDAPGVGSFLGDLTCVRVVQRGEDAVLLQKPVSNVVAIDVIAYDCSRSINTEGIRPLSEGVARVRIV